MYTIILDPINPVDLASIPEISLLGMTGIDHASPGKTHSMKSYPCEIFSGLHLLCRRYVGFKLYDPKVDCGLDFAKAYELAQESRTAVLH